MRGTMMELIGFLPVEVRKERGVAELPFRDDLTQPTGPLHAGETFKLLKNLGYCGGKRLKPLKVKRGALKPLHKFIEWVRATFPLTIPALNLLGIIFYGFWYGYL